MEGWTDNMTYYFGEEDLGSPWGRMGRRHITDLSVLCLPGRRGGSCEATECPAQSERRRPRAASERGVRGESSEEGFPAFPPCIKDVPLTLLGARCEGARFISRARSKERARGKGWIGGVCGGEGRETGPPDGAVASGRAGREVAGHQRFRTCYKSARPALLLAHLMQEGGRAEPP